MEIFLVGVIIIFIFIYTGKINTSKFVDDNKDTFNILKEKDYEFLLLAKYGDRVVDAQSVFMGRIKRGALVTVLLVLVFISKLNFLNIVISIIIGFFVSSRFICG